MKMSAYDNNYGYGKTWSLEKDYQKKFIQLTQKAVNEIRAKKQEVNENQEEYKHNQSKDDKVTPFEEEEKMLEDEEDDIDELDMSNHIDKTIAPLNSDKISKTESHEETFKNSRKSIAGGSKSAKSDMGLNDADCGTDSEQNDIENDEHDKIGQSKEHLDGGLIEELNRDQLVKEEFKDDISDGLDFLDDPIPDDTEQLKDLYEKYTMKYAQKLSQAEIDRIVSEALEDEYELKSEFYNFYESEHPQLMPENFSKIPEDKFYTKKEEYMQDFHWSAETFKDTTS